MERAITGQLQIVQWRQEHPDWVVRRWACSVSRVWAEAHDLPASFPSLPGLEVDTSSLAKSFCPRCDVASPLRPRAAAPAA